MSKLSRENISTVPLGKVARFIRGITFKPSDVLEFGSEGSTAVMRTKNVQEKLDTSDVWAVPSRLVKRADQLLQEGDILVSSANSWNLVGKCSWVPNLSFSSTFGGFVSVLRANPNALVPRYLFHWFSSDRVQERLRSFGQKTTNISNLNISRAETMQIPLPSLGEQRRIVAILDKAEQLRAKRQASLALLDEIPQAVFFEMFGEELGHPRWTTLPLHQIVAPGTIVTYGIVQAGEEVVGGVPYIRTGDIVRGEIVSESLRRTDPSLAAKFLRSRLNEGDIVMSIRATVGTTALVPKHLDGANLTQGTARISPGPWTNGVYLLNFLRTPAAQRWLDQQVKGATFREITLARLRELPTLIPPLDLQNRYSKKIEGLNKVRDEGREFLHYGQCLFNSVIRTAFGGDF